MLVPAAFWSALVVLVSAGKLLVQAGLCMYAGLAGAPAYSCCSQTKRSWWS